MPRVLVIRSLTIMWAIVALHPHCGHCDDFPEIYNSEQQVDALPMAADEAAAGMELPAGFRVSVFAAEPDVQNPIAMTWDQRGRLWVAENFTYAERAQHFDLSLRDRVLIFEDADNDGIADSRKVFTDQVQMLTSVEVGRGGVWLMCPSQLLFIPDADQDDIPDGPAKVVLDGFEVAENNYHNYANGLKWGPDGWLYGRCGHSCPGRIGAPGTPDELRIPIDGGVWRFHPEREVFEALCHGTVNPWGHDWDRNGELFFTNTVIGHLWHVMPGAHFKESFGESNNPYVYERLDTIADHYHYDTTGNQPGSREGVGNNMGGGHVHIGAMIYQGDQWPEQYRDSLFTLNMHGRRCNIDRLERHGSGFVGRHEPDFFAAADPFFRGLEISQAPDGNVFAIDWSDTGECHEKDGVHRTSGRIFKISYGEPRESGPVSKPWCLAGEGKLPRLWRRYQAGETTPEYLRGLLSDPDEHVRAWAIRLLTDFWPLDTIVGPRIDATYPDAPESLKEFIRMAREDDSGLVHLVLASVLQRLPAERRAGLAAALVQHEHYVNDRDLPLLVWFGLIPLGESDPLALVEVAKACRWPETLTRITRYLASHIKEHPEPIDSLLASAPEMPVDLQQSVLTGLQQAFEGWRRAPQPSSWEAFLRTEVAMANPDAIRSLRSLFGDGRALDEIRSIVFDKQANLQLRHSALQTLIDSRPEDLRSICESLMDVRSLNATAVKGLVLFNDPEVGRQLAGSYQRFHPVDRPALMDVLVSRPTFAAALLDAVDQRNSRVPSNAISAFHARQIRSLGDETLNRKLAEVWGELRDSPEEKQQLMAELRGQLSGAASEQIDLSAGRLLFKKTCSQCHRLFGDGAKIGPDLTGAQRNNLDYLLSNIIDPSAVVNKDFRMSIVVTTDGRVLNGLIVSHDENRLVLQTQTELQSIPAEDIAETRETTESPMPDSLLNNLSPADIRNLFVYLQHPSQVALPEESQ